MQLFAFWGMQANWVSVLFYQQTLKIILQAVTVKILHHLHKKHKDTLFKQNKNHNASSHLLIVSFWNTASRCVSSPFGRLSQLKKQRCTFLFCSYSGTLLHTDPCCSCLQRSTGQVPMWKEEREESDAKKKQ